jgi:hypothetical protein
MNIKYILEQPVGIFFSVRSHYLSLNYSGRHKVHSELNRDRCQQISSNSLPGTSHLRCCVFQGSRYCLRFSLGVRNGTCDSYCFAAVCIAANTHTHTHTHSTYTRTHHHTHTRTRTHYHTHTHTYTHTHTHHHTYTHTHAHTTTHTHKHTHTHTSYTHIHTPHTHTQY